MSLLQEILALAESTEQAALQASVDTLLGEAFDECLAAIMHEDSTLEEAKAVKAVVCMADDRTNVIPSDDESAPKAGTKSLKESLDPEYQADMEILEGLSDVSIVMLNTIIAESFEQAVERILKSDRKLRMVAKDGTKYKNRRRAAEAAVGASMRAVFGKKGLAAKGRAGKK